MVSVTVSGDAWLGNFLRAPCERSREGGGCSDVVWKILLRCVIFADVHYTLDGVKKISGITVLPFVFGG